MSAPARPIVELGANRSGAPAHAVAPPSPSGPSVGRARTRLRSRVAARARALLQTLALLCAVLLAAPEALAQMGPPGSGGGFGGSPGPVGGGGGGGGRGRKKPPPKKPEVPEGTPDVHPATGGETTLPQGDEPTLPDDPLAMSDAVRLRIGSSARHDEQLTGLGPEMKRQYFGLYYQERSGQYSVRAAFPVWYERRMPSASDASVVDRGSSYGLLYFNQRSAEKAVDIVFPLVFNTKWRTREARSTIVGPVWNHVDGTTRDNWLAPLYFTGRSTDALTGEPREYRVVPPFLTYLRREADAGMSVVGPGFCSWKGGSRCDARTAEELRFGVIPLYWYQQTSERKLELALPLLHYYRYDDRRLRWINVYGVYIRRHAKQRDFLHVAPIYFSIWGEDERHITLLPFGHIGRKGAARLYVTPLFAWQLDAQGDTTFATWLYARHRGRNELDMYTPLYWHFRSPRTGEDLRIVLPFLYARTGPREATQAFFPFFSHRERFGLSDTYWITPLFRLRNHIQGYSWAVNPLVYVGRDGYKKHRVVNPLYYDFHGRGTRFTAVVPFVFRHRKLDSLSHLTVPVYYRRKDYAGGGSDWQLHVAPLVSFRIRPDGHSWNFLYGFVGWTNFPERRTLRILWIPNHLYMSDEERERRERKRGKRSKR